MAFGRFRNTLECAALCFGCVFTEKDDESVGDGVSPPGEERLALTGTAPSVDVLSF